MDQNEPDARSDATAHDAVSTVGESATRRGFLGFLTFALGSVPVLGGFLATMRAGLAPAFSGKPERIALCKLSEVPDDGIKEVSISYEVRNGPIVESVARVVFVTRDPKTRAPIAMNGECTHLGCPVQNRELKIEGSDRRAPLTCPCHGGMFSRTGKPLAGPPRFPLRRLPLRVPGDPEGVIYLELS